MDFLLLLPEHQRIVLEIDGRQHYTDDFTQQPSPSKYAEMVAEDRRLRLTGYEVYRFGGYELMGNNQEQLLQTKTAIKTFIEKLFEKHNLVLTHLT
ncbi:hypothetical protein OEV98_12490 [Caldibacillus lycopersici]|uniref:DUF559 domain-containing protein n=1 Tax=Perspicuibacillus lycopersici TaxID=1325689 RepID=A0AAE3IYG0_9BACI|nr:hypothetical protein [Perspicuibacillus lycopersici]MCU9614355.1 hypothetical protein [Perspicuibacillus lycopersici]